MTLSNPTNLDNLALSGSLGVAGNAVIAGTLTAAGIIGTVSEISAFVGTPDNGTTQTLTGAMITGSPVFVAHVSTGGSAPSLTLPLATVIIAANAGWVVGNSYLLRIINTNSGIATILTNTGITLTGTATLAPNSQADFAVTMTAATTVSVVRVNAIGTTINGLTITASTGTLTIAAGKTFTVSNTLALAGTDSTVMTFPGTSATIARTDAANTFTGNQAFSGYILRSVGNALTAAGTTRADALQLAAEVNNVTTAGSGTGIILPVGVVGMRITVFNAGANPIKVYASGSETIDTVAGATGVTLTNAKRCEYFFTVALTWISAQLGVISG